MIGAEYDPSPGSGRAERAFRKEVSARIGLRKRGYAQSKVDLLNISKTGFLIEATMQLAIGEQVFLSLPRLESRVAHVAWTDEFRVGCEFEQPLADYVFDDVLARLDQH